MAGQINYSDLPEDTEPAESSSPDNGIGGALSQALTAQNSTTAEAQGYARKILDRALSGKEEEGEQSILDEMQQGAEQARLALRQARERLLGQQIDPREAAFARAQAFLSPTRTGHFSDNLANWAGVEGQQLREQRELEAAKSAGLLGIDTQLSGVNQNVLSAKLALQKLHEQGAMGLGKDALTVLGKSISNRLPLGAAPMSNYGKQAADEGLKPGSADYQFRVHDLIEADVKDKQARAGVDVTGDSSPEARAQLANVNGVPADVPDPWSGLSTRARLQAQANEQRTAVKQLGTYPAMDSQYQAGLRALEEFQKLNKVTHTGPELGSLSVGGVHAGLHGVGADAGHGEGWNLNPFSWFAGFKPNIQQMNKDVSLLTPLVVPEKGFGRVTNMDLGLFKSGMVGVDKSKQANDAIGQALRIRLQNDLDRHEFEQNYFQTHQHLRGAEAAWNDYLNKNPIFDPNDPNQGKAGHYTLNPYRLRYDEYFRQRNGGGSHLAGISETDRNDPVNAGLTDEQILAAKEPAKAEGGRVHYDSGGEVETGSNSGLRDALAALRSGATFKMSPGRENSESPGENLALEGLGAGGVTALLAALASRLRGGKALPKLLANPHLQASLIGGGAGALAGGASSRDTDPTADALTYGVTGALAGPLARLGVRGGVGTVGKALDSATGNTVGAGTRRMIDSITSDNPDWNNVAAGLRRDARLKVPSTIGDSIGPRTSGLATAALTKDTPQGAAYAQQLADRQTGANTRVTDQVNQALKPDAYLQKQEQLTDALYANAAPLYDAAYKQFPQVKSQALFDLMNTPAGQEAAARAFTKMQNRQLPVGQPDATGMVQSPSLQYLDHVKRSLDDMITREEGSGVNYQATDDGRVLRQMRQKLVSEIDAATAGPNGTPGPWQQARAQYAGDLEVRDALRSGNEDFQKLTPSELAAKVHNMSYAEKDAFLSGVSENLFNRLGSTPDNQNPAAKIASTPALKEKMTALFDKPADAVKFLDALNRESEIFNQSKGMLRTSGKAQAESAAPKSFANAARSRLMRSDTADEISGIASAQAGKEAQEKIARLRAAADRLTRRSDIGNALGNAGAAGIATGVTPSDSGEDNQVPIDYNNPVAKATGGLMRLKKTSAGGGKVDSIQRLIEQAMKSLKSFRSGPYVEKVDIPTDIQPHVARWMFNDEWPYSEDLNYTKKTTDPGVLALDKLTNQYGLENPLTLFRGLSSSDVNLKQMRNTHQSFTADPELAKRYYANPEEEEDGPGTVLIAQVPRGLPGAALRVSGRAKGQFINQDEVLLPRGLSWNKIGNPQLIEGTNYQVIQPSNYNPISKTWPVAKTPWSLDNALDRYNESQDR